MTVHHPLVRHTELTDAQRLAVVRELGVLLDDGEDRRVPACVLLERYAAAVEARRESEANRE